MVHILIQVHHFAWRNWQVPHQDDGWRLCFAQRELGSATPLRMMGNTLFLTDQSRFGQCS
jgi:hypothetical protein